MINNNNNNNNNKKIMITIMKIMLEIKIIKDMKKNRVYMNDHS